MRLQITEQLKRYNAEQEDKLTLRDLALLLYEDKDTIDQTKVNRISALNTGRAEASVSELNDLSYILKCSCENLME